MDGAIHRRGGPAILAECRALRESRYRDGLPTGQAVATTAGELPARWVIHTVGPVYSAVDDPAALLASCHIEALRVADEERHGPCEIERLLPQCRPEGQLEHPAELDVGPGLEL